MSDRLAALRAAVADMPPLAVEGCPRVVLFFAFTDGDSRATVVSATGDDFDRAWRDGIAQVPADAAWLRVDRVDAVERTIWSALRTQLAKIKRNYFRLGIALDAAFEHAFLETELNANAMLYGGAAEATAIVNEKNFGIYAAKRHGLPELDFPDEGPVWLFSTRGAFAGADGEVHAIAERGRNAGRRTIERLAPEDVTGLIDRGSRYLATQVRADGRFHYGWHPCFDREIGAYNSLRHASSLYAMLEAWEVTRDDGLKAAIDRALGYLVGTLIQPATLPGGDEAAFLVDAGAEIKLGGNAVAILALVKHAELTGSSAHDALLERLARGILHMQDAGSGRFVHVLHHPSLAVKQDFRIIYYEGEAAFGLMRLYEHSGDPRWLAAVERAFEHFIREKHWTAHDHWLSYCVNELTRHRPEERYYRFGLDNFKDYLGFVEERITTFPTLLELMMAAERMVSRLRADPALSHLLDEIDVPRFYRALHTRAHYLLNGHFWPELAMFYAKPAKIAGSFFIRHHAFRVRIDDVEHYLSGFVAYRKYLLARAGSEEPGDGAAVHWNAAEVQRASGGRWTVAPPTGWSSGGLCTYAPSMRAGDMVAVRSEGDERGVSEARLPRLAAPPAALITREPDRFAGSGAPVLAVDDINRAILALGNHARSRMRGRLIAVTGSAGKTTTVAMMAQALTPWGPVGETRFSANLPHGLAWNLASIPWDTPHIVLELAIGRMAQNARMARPDVAIFTNVLPAHLEYHRTVEAVADRKSAIFEGMAPGGAAILNRDMDQWDRVHAAARARDLAIVHYGRGEDCDFRLIEHDPATGLVVARVDGAELRYTIGAPGEHMALNSLAVLAAVRALGHDLAPAIAALGGFRPVEGRGRMFDVTLDGRRIAVIDDAYNANPGSMEMGLALLGSRAGRRIAVLGEMLELGAEAARYHTALAAAIEREQLDRVFLIGDLYAGLAQALPDRCAPLPSLDAAKQVLKTELRDGDTLLLKGSHGSAVHTLVGWLERHP